MDRLNDFERISHSSWSKAVNLTVVAMVKNEIDVIRECCGHFSALFDDVVMVDHRSTDGTREYLVELSKLNDRFHMYYLEEPGYYQSMVMTWIVHNVEQCKKSDWVFFLDADEILPFGSRAYSLASVEPT